MNNLIIEALNNDPFSKLIIVNPSFGPKTLNGKGMDDDHHSIELEKYIEEIQKNAFYSELPEFNIQKINGSNRIEHIIKGFDEFLTEYFSNEGEKLIKIIEKHEKDREKEENPFPN